MTIQYKFLTRKRGRRDMFKEENVDEGSKEVNKSTENEMKMGKERSKESEEKT